MRVQFEPEAVLELAAAVTWYEHQQVELGGRLITSVDVAVARIAVAPHSFPITSAVGTTQIRRVLLSEFPYALVFIALSASELRVIAVAHTSRKPGYWRERMLP